MSNLRPEIFNAIIQKRGYDSYLEVGVDNPNNTFNKIIIKERVGVDPYNDKTGCHAWNDHNKTVFKQIINGTFYPVTSDEFFENNIVWNDGYQEILGRRHMFDIVFLDGLHTKDQIEKDFWYAFHTLNKGGIIFIDDVCPNSEYEAKPIPDPGQPWRGDVYKFFTKLRMQHPEFVTGVIGEIGAGFAFIGDGSKFLYQDVRRPDLIPEDIDYKYYSMHRYPLMREMTWESFKRLYM